MTHRRRHSRQHDHDSAVLRANMYRTTIRIRHTVPPPFLFNELWIKILSFLDPVFYTISISTIAKYFFSLLANNLSLMLKVIYDQYERSQLLFHIDQIREDEYYERFQPSHRREVLIMFLSYQKGSDFETCLTWARKWYTEFRVKYDIFTQWLPSIRAYYGDMTYLEEYDMYSNQHKTDIMFYSILGANRDFLQFHQYRNDYRSFYHEKLISIGALLCNDLEFSKPLIKKYFSATDDYLYPDPLDLLLSKKMYSRAIYFVSEFARNFTNYHPSDRTVYSAIRSNNIDMVKLILNLRDDYSPLRRDCLVEALRGGNIEIVQYLLEKGIKVTDSSFRSLCQVNTYYQAVLTQNPKIVELILSHGDITQDRSQIELALESSCKISSTEIVTLFLDRGIVDDPLNPDLVRACLRSAIRGGNLSIVKLLETRNQMTEFLQDQCFLLSISFVQEDIFDHFFALEHIRNGLSTVRNSYGESPIMIACLKGNQKISIVEKLLLYENDINEIFYQEPMLTCPLLSCAGNFEISRVLIRKGANVKVRDSKGATPLLLAIRSYPHVEVLNMYLEYGSSLEEVDFEGNHVLTYLLLNRNSFYQEDDFNDIIERLHELGFPFDKTNLSGETALLTHIDKIGPLSWRTANIFESCGILFDTCDISLENALMVHVWEISEYVFNEDVDGEMIEFYLQQGIDINHRNISGQNILAYTTANVDLMIFLVSKGADITAKDNLGNNMLHITITRSLFSRYVERVIIYLLSQIDENETNHIGVTALDLAIEQGAVQVINLMR